jgi:hypothetical protein
MAAPLRLTEETCLDRGPTDLQGFPGDLVTTSGSICFHTLVVHFNLDLLTGLAIAVDCFVMLSLKQLVPRADFMDLALAYNDLRWPGRGRRNHLANRLHDRSSGVNVEYSLSGSCVDRNGINSRISYDTDNLLRASDFCSLDHGPLHGLRQRRKLDLVSFTHCGQAKADACYCYEVAYSVHNIQVFQRALACRRTKPTHPALSSLSNRGLDLCGRTSPQKASRQDAKSWAGGKRILLYASAPQAGAPEKTRSFQDICAR